MKYPNLTLRLLTLITIGLILTQHNNSALAQAADMDVSPSGGGLEGTTTQVSDAAAQTDSTLYSGTQAFQTTPGKGSDEPDICGITGGASYWFAYVPPENGVLTLNTDGSSFDTLLGVFLNYGTNFSSMVQIACDDNSGTNGITSALMLQVTNGVTYYIMVDGKNGAYGNANLTYNLNTPPSLSTITPQTTLENQTVATNFTVADRETLSGNLFVSATSSDQTLVPDSGIVLGGSGSARSITITPVSNQYGTNTITITVSDGTNLVSRSFSLQVTKTNHPPVALSDTFARQPYKSITISTAALLRNDYDPDGDPLLVTSVSAAKSGRATVTKNSGFICYTPQTGFNATDSFTYTLSDGINQDQTATVYINVSPTGQTIVY